MANFSVNQNLQMYVAKTDSVFVDGTTVTTYSHVGDVGLKKVSDLNEMWFYYKGVDGVMKTDTIQLKNLDYVKTKSAKDMVTVMKKVEVTLDSTINSGAPVSGQDYVLSINFKNFFSSGDASQYFKDAAVHATASMTASDFYKAMVNSLNAAFSREPGATKTSNPYLKFSWKPNATTATTADAIVIEELPQEWALGTKKARRIMFDVAPTTIYTGGDDVVWGTVTDATPAKSAAVVGTNAVGNGQQIADLEWFCMGERGDQYRNVGWPNVINTTYLVDASQTYHTILLHYAFTDTGVNSYRTEKEMLFVYPATTAGAAAANALIDAIETATGLTIAGVSNS